MNKYFNIFLASYRFWFMRNFEFRSEVILWSINSIVWGILSLVSVELIFGQVNSIAGWSREQVLLLTTTYYIFESLLWWFVLPSLLVLNGVISNGKLDGYLLKPGSSQFFVSFSKFEFDNYPRVFFLAIVLWQMVRSFSIHISLINFIGYLLMILTGFIIFYALFFMLTTLTIWLQRVFNLEDFLTSIVSIGKAPTQIFKKGLYVVFIYFIPAAFVATFPIQILIGKSGIELVLLGLTMAGLFLIISNKFWNFALKHYSSASS